MTVTVQSGCSVRIMLERMGKTMFFRSGDHPLILTEEQREERKQGENHCSCFNAINGSGPAYLSKLLHVCTLSCTLRSSSDTCKLEIQQYKHKTHSFHTFCCFGPHIWNLLSQDLRHCSTLSSFKAKLKTFLFSQYFCPNSLPVSVYILSPCFCYCQCVCERCMHACVYACMRVCVHVCVLAYAPV